MTATYWNRFAPTLPELPQDQRADFFATAPVDTVVEVDDDLFRRLPRGEWRHLEELVFSGHSYSEYREHDSSTPSQLAERAGTHATVRVLRLGPGPYESRF